MVLEPDIPEWIVRKVEPHRDFSLSVWFADGSKKRVDMKPVIKQGKVFEPLRNIEIFMMAKEDGSSVAWNDEIDIAPEYLYANGIDEI